MKKKEVYINVFLNLLPNFLYLIKKKIILSLLKYHGRNIKGMRYVTIDGYNKITIGNNFFSASGLALSATEGINIGNDVTFGPDVMIFGGNHKTNIPGFKINQIHTGDKLDIIVVENDVWVGARTIILSGVIIGEGSIIGAGSVVTKKMPYYYVCAGNPCKPIKPRFKDRSQLKKHLVEIKSNLTLDMILQQYKEMNLNSYL